MAKYRKLRIVLTKKQRSSLERTVRKGTSGAMEIRRANVLLLVDESGDRNKRQKGVGWQFSVGDARTRVKHLYPTIKIYV